MKVWYNSSNLLLITDYRLQLLGGKYELLIGGKFKNGTT